MLDKELSKLKQNDEEKQWNKDRYKSIKYERRRNKTKNNRRKVMRRRGEKNQNEEKIQTNKNRKIMKSKGEERKKALRNIKLIAEWQSLHVKDVKGPARQKKTINDAHKEYQKIRVGNSTNEKSRKNKTAVCVNILDKAEGVNAKKRKKINK